MTQLYLFVACVLLLISCSIKQIAVKDLDFIYNIIYENHPGVYNEEDPNFCKNLENSYIIAKSAIKESRSILVQKKSISNFAKSFNDTHLWVNWFDDIVQKENYITPKFSISEFSKDVVWIILPSFDLKIEQEKDFREIVKQVSDLQIKKNIIFDLRGDQGGNSDYGSQIVNSLFGNEYTHQKLCLHNKKIFVDWRASKGNLNHISNLLIRYPTNQWLEEVKYGLEESLEKGDLFYREYFSKIWGSAENITSEPKFDSKIIIITDSVNVSAALDFIDELKIMTNNIILIGQKTKPDRLYMEVRLEVLPSGSGNFSFPIKVYHNRLRLDNELYVPNIEFNDVHNTSLLQGFILNKIKMGEL